MRYFIELAYKGTNFHGWQIQPNAVSVQELLQESLGKYFGQDIPVVGCGRTDTGVHASQFYAQFEFEESFDLQKASYSINNMLDHDIVLYRIIPVAADLHARFSAESRTYQYFIHFNKNPFIQETSFRYRVKLDLSQMNLACKEMMKYSDFTSFSKVHTEAFTNNCEIMSAQWKPFGDGVVFEIKANRFLRNMVRAIVGTMLELGSGKIDLEQFKAIIEAKDRGEAGTSVPACGLFLYKVEYPEGSI